MNSKLTKMATAAVLSLCGTAPTLAGSVTQPGETVGVAAVLAPARLLFRRYERLGL